MTENSNPTQVLLAKAHMPANAISIYTNKLHRKPLFLHATPSDAREVRRQERKSRRQRQKNPGRKPKPLTAREKRALYIYEVPKSAEKYAIYEPLHALWVGYMQEVLNIDPKAGGGGGGGGAGVGAGQAQIGLKLASADYHGALFEVVRSRCPSRVGIRGVCVKETKGMFYLVTGRDELKEIPKEHTVFRFELPVEEPPSENINAKDSISKPRSMIFELHGSQFMYRAAERAGRKFKQKPATDL